MTLYAELQRIDTAKAICKMAELLLPRFTTGKVLTVSLSFSIQDFGESERPRQASAHKETTLVFYRPDNFMFVGQTDSDFFSERSIVKYLICHDSCWRDSVERAIREICHELSEKYKDQEGLTVFTSFGTFGTEVRNGDMSVNTSKRHASYIALKKETA